MEDKKDLSKSKTKNKTTTKSVNTTKKAPQSKKITTKKNTTTTTRKGNNKSSNNKKSIEVNKKDLPKKNSALNNTEIFENPPRKEVVIEEQNIKQYTKEQKIDSIFIKKIKNIVNNLNNYLENSNKKRLMLVLLIFAIILILISTSYAMFMYMRTGKGQNLTTGYIEFSMLDGENVALNNAFPQSDEDGNKNDSYKFTVNNNSTEGFQVYYNIGLVPDNNDTNASYFTNDQIKYSLIKNGNYVVGSETSGKYISDSTGLDIGKSNGEGVILSNQLIRAKATDLFELKIWIADTVDYSNQYDENGVATGYFNDYSYSTKVKINAQGHAFAYDGNPESPKKDGEYIELTLYYPSNATEKKWRLDNGDIRTGEDSTSWNDYTGPIRVKLEDVNNIYISYKINGKTEIIAPTGKAVVDIIPASYKIPEDYTTRVIINYDSKAISRQYSIDGGQWIDYNGEFHVSPNTLIEAKVVKEENVYDSEGNLLFKNKVTDYDRVYISKWEPTSPGGPGGSTGSGGPGGGWPDGVNPSGPGSSPAGPVSGGGTPTKPGSTTNEIDGPIINTNTNEIVESINVTIDVPNKVALLNKNYNGLVKRMANSLESKNLIYYKIGTDGVWQEYNGSFEVTQNVDIYSYYINSEGIKSKITKKSITNIKKKNRPYLIGRVDYNVDSATVTFTGQDYEKLEYSFDDYYYQPYTQSINVTSNQIVYGRATNSYGSTYVNVVVDLSKEKQLDILNVGIVTSVNPSTLNGNIVASTNILINYDERATTKLYKLGQNGTWEKYTGEFTLKENTTIYAYASSDNGIGQATKVVDFLTLGINEPVFYPSIPNNIDASSITMKIEYDSTADVKKYSIDGGEWIDYTGPFEIKDNCIIEAYSKNSLNYESKGYYRVTNIKKSPDFTILERDAYYIIKINYPSQSIPEKREYKFKNNGWITYKNDGILLIKPEYKDKILKDPNNIKVEDENGKTITFKGDYYLLDIPLSSLYGNLLVRWDSYSPDEKPTYTKSTERPAKKVTVAINYSEGSTNKLYKVVNPDGSTSGWMNYVSPITVFEKGTMIFAKSENSYGIWSDTSNITINNIDYVAPIIILNGDFETPKRIVNVQIKASDDQLLSEVYYAKGKLNANSTIANGKRISSGSIVQIKENSIYTVCAIDYAGNETVEHFEIKNIDSTAPNIFINVFTAATGTEASFEIEYGDSVTKQYKVGETGTWVNYNGKFTLKSLDVYKLSTDGKSVVVYARGVEANGNEAIISEKAYMLDLMLPKVQIAKTGEDGTFLLTYEKETEKYIHVGAKTKIDTKNVQECGSGEKAGECKSVSLASSGTRYKLNANTWYKLEDDNVNIELENEGIVQAYSAIGDNHSEMATGRYVIKTKAKDIYTYIKGIDKYGEYTDVIKVNDERYKLHVYSYKENQIWSSNMTFGNSMDIGTINSDAERMVIVKVDGNITINKDVKIEPYYNEYGGPKGFTIYATGTITNNGTIDNSHGGKAEGQNVYLYRNDNGSYEYVPSLGGIGGESHSHNSRGVANIGYSGYNGKDGSTVSNRGTGGGASGGAYVGEDDPFTVYVSKGGTGTSYSGGSGSGGIDVNYEDYSSAFVTGEGSSTGGAGGIASAHRWSSRWVTRYAGGGAGNPGGYGMVNGSSSVTYKGSDGTGGLLIIYANRLNNNGSITAIGSSGGGADTRAGGGSSGGGSINIFTTDDNITIGNTNVNGGPIIDTAAQGGAGGTGTITYGYIKNGRFNQITNE